MYDFIKKVDNIVELLEEACMIITLTFLVIFLFSQVTLRYVFSSGIIWSDEIVGYMFVIMAIVGSAVAIREDKHISLTFFLNKFPKTISRILKLIINIIILLFIFVFIVSGIIFAHSSILQTSIVLRIPMYIPYTILPLGGLLMIWELIKINFQKKKV